MAIVCTPDLDTDDCYWVITAHDLKSLKRYLANPDGNGIELYVDVSDAWRKDPNKLVETLVPLEL